VEIASSFQVLSMWIQGWESEHQREVHAGWRELQESGTAYFQSPGSQVVNTGM
jgi:hypothetical protein